MYFFIEEVPIYFPYPSISSSQREYMSHIILTLKEKGHCLIEMPSGTGKTIALLSSIVSYLLHTKTIKPFKILYCSRTIQEIEKVLIELKFLINYISGHIKTDFLALGLTSRRNLCINDAVFQTSNVDHACNRLIRNDIYCDYFKNLRDIESMPIGVYSLDDLTVFGKENGVCPYFLARKVLKLCDCVVFTYNYLIDPRIKASVLNEFNNECVIVFDEAHNIDNACIEAMSVEVRRSDLDNCNKEIKIIEDEMRKTKEENKRILENEYNKLKTGKMPHLDGTVPYSKEMIEGINEQTRKGSNVENKGSIVERKEPDVKRGIGSSGEKGAADVQSKGPESFFNLNYEFAPGNIRNAVHFVSAVKRITEFFKTKLKTTHLTTETTNSFCTNIRELTLVDKKTLSYMSTRFGVLVRTLKLIDTDFGSIKRLCDFVTLASQYSSGFSIIFEPFDDQAPTVFNPILRLYCVDASIALKSVFKYKNVIITSGTLSPLDIYAKILDFTPVISKEITVQYERNNIGPLIITKGNDQMILKSGTEENSTEPEKNVPETGNKGNVVSSSYTLRNDPAVIRNYGLLVIEFAKIVPDGLVIFFPSYLFMEQIISAWCEIKMIDEILKHKLIFIETPDQRETQKAMDNYNLACSNGRGGLLFSIARGKVSEGVDFKDEIGRCCIVLGVPYQYTESVRLKKRLEYLSFNFQIKPNDFLNFDAMRQAAQCLGRVLRGKNDYGLMVMADYRFNKKERKNKLPRWILNCLEDGNTNLSIDMATCIAKRFYREMAQ